MSLSRRYGIINIAYHGSFHDGKELYTMSNVKRKDSKNRNLRNGESQRKDGRYVYKYTDIYGKPQFIYSWKLVPTDKTPAGKRDDISLREKETQIKKTLTTVSIQQAVNDSLPALRQEEQPKKEHQEGY